MAIKTYRVRENRTFGAFGQFGPGAIVRLDEREAASFLDKLRLADDQESVPPAPAELHNDLGIQIPDDLKLIQPDETQPEEETAGIKLQESTLDLSEETTEESKPEEKKKPGRKPKAK